MTGPELSQRRSRAGLSVDELAEALNRHVDEVAAWEQIPGTLPRAVDRDVEWILASAERGRAFEAAGIPVCPWVTERERDLDARDSKALEVWITQSEAHAKTCDVCQRREAFGRTLPPLPPFPMSPQLRLLASVAGTIQRLPGWLRPAAVGAILIGGLTIVRAILLLVLRRAAPSLELLLTVLAAAGVGAYGGAVGGLAYGAAREWTKKLGAFGPYALGVICVYAYLLAFGIPLAVFGGEDMFRTASGWIAFTIVGTIFGLIIGRSWFRDSGTPAKERS